MPHLINRACIVREFPGMHFPGCRAGRSGPIPQPPRSLDITPLGLFFCGDKIKDNVCNTHVTSLDEMKHRTVAVIETIA